jgi:uncharacterized membrane protein (UPF0127 family)
MKAKIENNGTSIEIEVTEAKSFLERLRGLMYRSSLPEGHGLLIEPCNSIHTFGMRFAIDVLFLDAANCILKAVHSLNPGKVVPTVRDGHAVLEINAGTLPPDYELVGKTVEFID